MIFDIFKTQWKTLLGAAIACVLCSTAAYVKGRSDQSRISAAERAAANVEALKTANTANEKAAVARVSDALNNAKQNEELIDAVASTPDTLPDPSRVAIGCSRLRASGTDTSTISACGGH